jgi:ribosomal protein S18 acetylase RimI-like enzyme
MLKRAFRTLRYAALQLKLGGPKPFFLQLKRQIYSKSIFLGLEKDLDTNGQRVSSKLPYSLQRGSEKDMEDLLARAKSESKGSVHELIARKWFYECGFHDCYVARTADTREICFVGWLLSTKDDNLVNQGFKSRLPKLEKDELLLENCYTFEKYRGKNIMPSVLVKLWQQAKSQGFKRVITYVRKDNRSSLRVFEKLGLNKFEEIPELKLFFFTKRKHRQALNAPGIF